MIEKYIQALKKVVLSEEFILGDSDTVLGMLYECCNENHPYDNEENIISLSVLSLRGSSIRRMKMVVIFLVNVMLHMRGYGAVNIKLSKKPGLGQFKKSKLRNPRKDELDLL